MTTTSIAWTDVSWNPVRGCSRVSAGCQNCYAEQVAGRFAGPGLAFEGFATTSIDHRWTGKVALVPEKLKEPLSWRKPRRIFVNSMSDLFHEGLSDADIDRVFGVMAWCDRHTFQVLTKRAERLRAYSTGLARLSPSERSLRVARSMYAGTPVAKHLDAAAAGDFDWPLPNVWLGVSVENQKAADERIPLLLEAPAAVRFVSYEPALGPVDFERETLVRTTLGIKSVQPLYCAEKNGVGRISWVIVGGESGPGARFCDIGWIRSVVRQCRESGAAVFVKQLGRRAGDLRVAGFMDPDPPLSDCAMRLADPKGGDPAEWPEDLRVREFPEVRP